MKFRNLNALVVSGGSFQGLTVIKGLRYSDSLHIIIADSSHENISKYFADSFYVVPEVGKKEQFLNSLLEICERENINIIIPSTDTELLPLAESLKLFKDRNIYVAVSNPDFLNIVRNKFSLYKFLAKEGFPALPILNITDKSLKFPILGKPLYSWGSKGILVLNSYNEMHKYNNTDLKNNYIWQPFLKAFNEYSIDCAINFDGKTSELVVRQRLKTIGGFAAITENVYDSIIELMAKNFLNLISSKGACGIFNIQVFKEGTSYYFSDVNPRIGTSAVFAYKLGINSPLFLCSYIKPEIYTLKHQKGTKSKKVKMVRYLEELWIEKENSDEVKAIVFDLDDTLINQKLWIVDKLEILWSKFSDILPEKKEFLLKAVQIMEEGNRSKLFDALAQEFQFPDNFKEELIKTYRGIEPQNCPLFPDVLPTLKELKKSGFKLALLTDNPPESQKQKIKICNLEEIFDTIVYSRELNQEKPSNMAFKEVSKRLKTPEQSLVMVGDNLYKDIIGSLDSGYRTAYWLIRDGTFFNFEQKLFDKLFGNKYNFRKINNLRYLLWNLK